MTLNSQANYPSTRAYVLKLHRNASSQTGGLAGRLENMTSSRSFEFHSGHELLAYLAQDLAASESVNAPIDLSEQP